MASALPSVFVASSVEGLKIAKAIQRRLAYAADVDIWDQATFDLSSVTIEALEERSLSADFAVFVLTPDDVKVKRERETAAVRDNVIFELGLFAGTIGRRRCFLVHDQEQDIDLPSDLAGITPATFRLHQSGNLDSSLGAACSRIEQAMEKLKLRRKLGADALLAIEQNGALCSRVHGCWWQRIDPDDASALSFVVVEPDPATGGLKMGGAAYHTDGRRIADWYTIGVSLDGGERKVSYIWEGSHPKDPNATYQGFGWIKFDDAPEDFHRGSGIFFNANLTDLASSRRKSLELRRCADAGETTTMTGGSDRDKAECVLKKLEAW